MSNLNNSGAFVALLWIVTIIISIGSGVLAWNWIEPDSFFSVIGFLILWSVLSKVGHFLAMGLVALLGWAGLKNFAKRDN